MGSGADAGSIVARWQPASTSWLLRAEAGVSHHTSNFTPAAGSSRTIASGSLSATGNITQALRVGIAAARAPFDETALLIANGVISSEYTGDASVALPGRFSLSGAASHAKLTGGSRQNSRDAFSGSLRWTYNRRWSMAVGARTFGYDTTSSDGYFAPQRYSLAEGSVRGRLGGNLGWNAEADAGVGSQRIQLFGATTTSRAAERGTLSAGYRFDPAHEITASANYANVAAPGQTRGSEYNYHSFTLRARFGF